MSKLEKYQTLIIFAAMPLGILLGGVPLVETNAESFVTPFLFVMIFGAFLNIPLKDYRRAFTNFRFSLTTAVINFVWTPVLVWLLGQIFLSGSPIMQIGFIMLMVTPCTDWYLIFTGLAKGNVALSATVLPVNLILQIVLLPIYLLIFGGIAGSVDMHSVLTSVTIMLLLPFTLAQIVKALLSRFGTEATGERVLGFFSTGQVFLLALAILSMFAAKGGDLLSNLNLIVILIVPIVLFYIINFSLAQLVGKKLRFPVEDRTSLTLTTIAKNSPMTLGVALMAFPDQPIIHLIMVIEPLLELPVMMLITKLLLLMRQKSSADKA